MHPQQKGQLVSLLNEVELGSRDWPDQVMQGFVCSLLRPNNKLGADGYRLIVLFSLVYRTWASIRSRRLCSWIGELTQHDACGFLLKYEAMELWYALQSACQGGLDLCGYSTDLVKAFNNLPRAPILQIARRLGAPARVVDPWFLQRVRRRFKIRDHSSQAITGSSSFAEGCPLSSAGKGHYGFGLPPLHGWFVPSAFRLWPIWLLLPNARFNWPRASVAPRHFASSLA